MQLTQYFSSSNEQIKRSLIKLASYNPRIISDQERNTIKRGIKKFGLVGGLVVNKQTDYTLVGGHQRLSVLDELNKYNPETQEGDYLLRVDVIDIPLQQEKELNILLNNPNAQGKWDYNALASMLPDINYKDAGLTDVDLSLLGIDLSQDLQLGADNPLGQAEKHSDHESQEAHEFAEIYLTPNTNNIDKVQHVKDVKEQVQQQALERAKTLESYIVLSFDSYESKMEFCDTFGYDATTKFINATQFLHKLEYDEQD